MTAEIKLKKYHAQVWDEPLLMDLSVKGQRGILVPGTEAEIEAAVGAAGDLIPSDMKRTQPPDLPEVAQPQVLRHFTRLSQMTMGNDVSNDIGVGTCTMKYSPKIHEVLARMPEVTALHPFQDEDTVQGALEIIFKLDCFLREISGMDQFSFQGGGGSAAILAMASIVHAYHEARGETDKRDEIITTIFSHPSDAAAAAAQGD